MSLLPYDRMQLRAMRAAFKNPVLNTDNPLTSGLQCLYLGGRPDDLTGGGRTWTNNGTMFFNNYQNIGFTGNAQGSYASGVGPYLEVPTRLWDDFSWVVWILCFRSRHLLGHFGCVGETNASSLTGVQEDWWRVRTTGTSPQTVAWFGGSDNGTSVGREHISYFAPVPASYTDLPRSHVLAFTRQKDANNGKGRVFYDGVFQNNNTGDNTPGRNFTTRTEDGCVPRMYLAASTQNSYAGAPLLLFGWYDRALTDEEVAEVSDNPLALIKESGSPGTVRRKRLNWTAP